jgi:hypothetical protein
MKIQANASGTRSIEVTPEHIETIRRYALLDGLVDSNGIIDEGVLEKLKYNIRSLLETETGRQDKDLLDLALDVVYHANMKAFGLSRLIQLVKESAPEEGQEQ